MKKYTKLSIQWFYNMLEKGECEIVDFKEQLEDKSMFGKPMKNFSPNYEEMSRDVVAFANKKGGFLFVGITDRTKEINKDFHYDNEKLFELIKQVQDRTTPSITLVPHRLEINGSEILVLEIPFSQQIHCTSKGEYLIRSNDGNKRIEPHEMVTVMAEKNMIVYDQKTWNITNWTDEERIKDLYERIKLIDSNSSLLKPSFEEFADTLCLTKEENGQIFPTTTGILLIGNAKALRELPYSQIKYVHYFNDGTYQPYEYSGNIIEIADACFNQLKSEIRKKEVHFGLFHDFIDDYSEIVLRELLINAIVHRDYSRQQIIEIRKYQSHIEFESPGTFPQGIDVNNYLRKTNSRNPNIIDIFRAIRYAEKAGSGMDKVFTDLLSKGKKLPMSKETDDSVTFTVESGIYSDKIIELSMAYKKETGIEMDMDRLLVLNLILSNKKMSYQQLENSRYISASQLKVVLDDLLEREFVEITGKTSGQKYIIHKSRAISTDDKINYAKSKKQEKASQKEAIIRYLNEFETITNAEARKLLKLPDSDMEYISRLFAEMVKSNLIKPISAPDNYKRVYSIVQK